MSTINEYIKKLNAEFIAILEKQMSCLHEWEKHGGGYRCTQGCGFHTSVPETMKLIEESQAQKKSA